MTVAQILSKAYRLTNTTSTIFLDGNATNVLADLNEAYGQRILDILRVQTDRNASQTEATTDLVSTDGLMAGDNGYNGEYAFPTDLLKPVRTEISFDGVNWYNAKTYDINEYDGSEQNKTDINADFFQSEPYVRFDRDSYFVRPLPATTISGGIHIWYEQRQADLNTGEPSFEKNLHDILAYDLAEQEAIMHSGRYDANWWTTFNTKKAEIQDRFLQFYQSRFESNLRMHPPIISYT